MIKQHNTPAGDHPVGTGVGVAGGAAAGAAVGMAGGPVGAVAGAIAGAVVGGLAGQEIAERFQPTEADDAYWRNQFRNEPYYSDAYAFEDYAPAYRIGHRSHSNGITEWEAGREACQLQWEAERGDSRLPWKDAEPAAQAAWRRASEIWQQIECADNYGKNRSKN